METSDRIWPNFELIQAFMHVLIACKYEKDQMKNSGENVMTTFTPLYEGCPKMPYNCIVSLKFKTNISLIHMQPVGTLFPDILLKLHKIS